MAGRRPMKRVLIISPHFVPVNAPDCQRVRLSLPYYRQFGWEAEVLAVHHRHRADWLDNSLLASLPGDVPVHYCGAVPRGITQFIGIHNLGLRCLPYLNGAARRLLRLRHYDLVFFSTTQFMVTPLGALWRKKFGVPYVIDIQDPWRSDYYERPGAPTPPGGWKYQFARLTAWLFEERAYREASGLISVSHHYFRDLRQRYPTWFDRQVRQVIPFGGPKADFDYLAAHPAPPAYTLPADGRRHWVAAGSLGAQFSHALRVLFAGLRRLREQNPAAAARLHFHFVGTSYAPAEEARPSAKPVAEAYGVGDLVTELPHRIGYLDSLRLMQAADGLVLLGTDDLAYSPSKIYPYYMTERPILALAHHESLLHDIIAQLKCACLVELLPPGREMEPPAKVAEFLALAGGDEPPPMPRRDPIWFNRNLTAEAGAQRQCALFDSIASGG